MITAATVVDDDHSAVILPYPARLCVSLEHGRVASERHAGPGRSGSSAHGGPTLHRASAPIGIAVRSSPSGVADGGGGPEWCWPATAPEPEPIGIAAGIPPDGLLRRCAGVMLAGRAGPEFRGLRLSATARAIVEYDPSGERILSA